MKFIKVTQQQIIDENYTKHKMYRSVCPTTV